ncbi:MAG: ribosome silencing factor [Thermoanaerobaculia bacterium]
MTARPELAAGVRDVMREVMAAADDRKALDLKAYDLTGLSDVTEYFILASGRSERQVEAIAEAILESLARRGRRPLHVEGLPAARWVLLDFADFVVHVFEPATREYYGLERLWRDAPDVTDALRGC